MEETQTTKEDERKSLSTPTLPDNSTDRLHNCWQFVHDIYYNHLPGTVAIQKNIQPEYSDIAVFYYAKSGLWHYAKTTNNNGDTFTIDEANYIAGKRTQREISFTDPNLKGFYKM